jgi:hypothetical protein
MNNKEENMNTNKTLGALWQSDETSPRGIDNMNDLRQRASRPWAPSP